MLVATVISPEENDTHKCDICELSYTSKHYLILLENKKLAYFRLEEDGLPQTPTEDVPQKCVCHECLFNLLTKIADGEKMKIKMIYFNTESYGVVDPNDEGSTFL